MLDLLVEMTNQYSVEKTGKSVDTTKKEMKQLLGIFFRMGLAKMPGTRCYWENDTRYDPVASTMSRNRFQLLMRVIYIVDNNRVTEEDKKDKLWKIRPWLEKFRNNCVKVVPDENNSIDEMMIPFKGKFSKIKQYVKGKPHPWGIKVWVRASATGIVCDFDVYQGNKERKERSLLGVGADVILKLCSSLPQNVPGQPSFNYKIYADNFFTGMALLVELQKLGIHYTGTVRPNCIPGINLQNEAEMKKKGRGIMDQSIEKNTKIVAVRWYDTRAVNVLSTFSGTDPRNPVSRFEKSKSMYVPVQRPAVIKLYNENMGGVDLHDCCVAKNSYRIKSKRWYMYIFWQTIRMMLVNAWLSYRRVTGLLGYSKRDTMNQRKFQARLATLLIQFENSSERKRGRPSAECSKESLVKRRRLQTLLPNPQIATDGYNHFIIKNDNHQRCRLCSLKTKNVCEKCNVFLCFTEKRNCFREFHFSS
ncbi:piggyBac transposable element-derived protein 3-like [Physella acuta]|uniref:piggyBac transposable element-derived protein 3-like n=1 Tax=Physella acuta TaxID=109671 RepID=UPI0027DD8AB8|nr:piggyBac transposable element-derived protein 3-like [Physella acuta]